MAPEARANDNVPGAAVVAVPVINARFNQLEPDARVAAQFTVEFESPLLSTSTLWTVEDASPCTAWNKTALVFKPKIGPLPATNNDTGMLILPVAKATWMLS